MNQKHTAQLDSQIKDFYEPLLFSELKTHKVTRFGSFTNKYQQTQNLTLMFPFGNFWGRKHEHSGKCSPN